MDYRYNRYSKKSNKKNNASYKGVYNQVIVCLVLINIVLFSRLALNKEKINFDNTIFSKISEHMSLKDLNEKVISVFSENKVISEILNGDKKESIESSSEEDDTDFQDVSETDVLTYERA